MRGLLLPLLLLLPRTGRKVLLQDVHLALEHDPFPFSYLPRRGGHLCGASLHLKLPSQGFQILLGLVALLRLLLPLLLLHPMDDVGVQWGFLWNCGGGRSGDFPWLSGSTWAATPLVSRRRPTPRVIIPLPLFFTH